MLHYKFAAVIVFMQISIYTFVNIFSTSANFNLQVQIFFTSSHVFFLFVTSNVNNFYKCKFLFYKCKFLFYKCKF